MGKRLEISPSIKPNLPARLDLMSAANRLPVELLAALLPSNWASA